MWTCRAENDVDSRPLPLLRVSRSEGVPLVRELWREEDAQSVQKTTQRPKKGGRKHLPKTVEVVSFGVALVEDPLREGQDRLARQRSKIAHSFAAVRKVESMLERE